VVQINLYALLFEKETIAYNRFHVIKLHKLSLVTQDVRQSYTAIREDLMYCTEEQLHDT